MIFKTCARFDCYVIFLFPDQHTVFILFLNKLAACALYLLLDVSLFAPNPDTYTLTFIDHCKCPAGSLQPTLARCTLTVSCQLQATFRKGTDMKRILKR